MSCSWGVQSLVGLDSSHCIISVFKGHVFDWSVSSVCVRLAARLALSTFDIRFFSGVQMACFRCFVHICIWKQPCDWRIKAVRRLLIVSLNHCNDRISNSSRLFSVCFTLGLILSSRAQQTRYDGKVHLLCKSNEEEQRHYYRQRETVFAHPL